MPKFFSNPEKEYIYQLLANYFDHLSLEKVRDEDNFSIYMAKFNCLLLNEQRFIVLMTPRDNYPPAHIQKIDELRWVSLQTRTLQNDYSDVLLQSYQQKNEILYKKELDIISRNNKISVYQVKDLPMTVSLLHTKGNEYEYPDKGNLVSALETFRTIVQFQNNALEF